MNALSSCGLSALGMACETGRVHVTQLLLSCPEVDGNAGVVGVAGDEEGSRTPIIVALEVSYLLDS